MQEDYSDQKWIGKKFNFLTVIGSTKGVHKSGKYNKHYNLWICQCDCGVIKTVKPYKVIMGKTKSCGCWKPEATRIYNKKSKVKHGGRHEHLYSIWRGIITRCFKSSSKDYDRYGGRGITVCDDWKNDYAKFREWAYANGYQENLTIDRIDVNGNYEPDNCRWADYKTQNRNKTNIKKYLYNGEMKCLTEISQETGVPFGRLYNRIFNSGWDLERAINEPVRRSS